MREKSATIMRDALADMLGILEYKVRNGVMSSDDVRTIITTLESGGGIHATVSDLAGYYHKSEADVRNVIHRHYLPKPVRGLSPMSSAGSAAGAVTPLKKIDFNQIDNRLTILLN